MKKIVIFFILISITTIAKSQYIQPDIINVSGQMNDLTTLSTGDIYIMWCDIYTPDGSYYGWGYANNPFNNGSPWLFSSLSFPFPGSYNVYIPSKNPLNYFYINLKCEKYNGGVLVGRGNNGSYAHVDANNNLIPDNSFSIRVQ